MKNIENYLVNKTTAAFLTLMTMSNTAFASGLESWTVGKKLTELGEFIISEIALPLWCISNYWSWYYYYERQFWPIYRICS